MSCTKTIKLSKKYQNNIHDLEKEQLKTEEIIHSTFEKFPNENNFNSMEYALDILVEDYAYIANDTILTNGKYVRYLDMKNPLDIKLRLGGFVLSDNGYSLSLKGIDRIFKVNKRNVLLFSQISDNDKIRSAIHEYV